MFELAPPVVGGRLASPQGCRSLPRYQLDDLRAVDVELCDQSGGVFRWHNGLDIKAPEGTPILAPWPGRIWRVYQIDGVYQLPRDAGSAGYGTSIVVELWPDCLMLCGHCAEVRTDLGARVEVGDHLGTVGRSCGDADDPACRFRESAAHVHLEFLRRWPVRGSDYAARYDAIATLANFGIGLRGDRFYWREAAPEVPAPSSPGGPAPALGPFPAEGIAPGESLLVAPAGVVPPAPVAPSSDAGGWFMLGGLVLLSRKRRLKL